MTNPIVVSYKQETFKPLAPSANILPVRAWRNIIGYLTEKEQDACTLVSRRSAVLVLCDPSVDLEGMDKRKKSIPINYKPTLSPLLGSTIGPTVRFLSHHPRAKDPQIQEQHRIIKAWMEDDVNVNQTVRKVCDIESTHPEYIPLYHGGRLAARVSMLFIEALLSTPYNLKAEKSPCSNPMIKIPSPDGPKTIGEALSEFPPNFTDHMVDVRKELLSCNPFLFANYEQQPESTWAFYLYNLNIFSQSMGDFFQELCKNYHIQPHSKYLAQLEILHQEFCQLAVAFTKQSLPERYHPLASLGVLLQILVPPAVLDKMAYASFAYGKVQKSALPLSERCLSLREDPDSQPLMQVRLLVQSIFIPEYRIKVYTHGCGGFFSEESPKKPNPMTEKEWAIQTARLLRKEKILEEVRDIFTKMILLSPKKHRTSINTPSSISSSPATKTIFVDYKTLKERTSVILPPGFSLTPYYNEKTLLEKVVQTDPDGQETIYLLTPNTDSVAEEELGKSTSKIPLSLNRRYICSRQSEFAGILSP
jgi:hypothetical protein